MGGSGFVLIHSHVTVFHREAYEIACLGVTEGDWEALARAALEGLEYNIARKAFTRTRNLTHLELIHSIQASRVSCLLVLCELTELLFANFFFYRKE